MQSMDGLPNRELVLVGGGHAHVQVLRSFAMEPPEARVTVVLDTPVAIYSGMVPGFLAGQYEREELEIDVVPLARRIGARVILAAAVGVDPHQKLIQLANRPAIPYDVASFDIGSTVAGLETRGVRQHAVPTRPISAIVRYFSAREERSPGRDDQSIVVVGGGAGGVEVAFTALARARRESETQVAVTIVSASDELLPGYPASLRRRVLNAARERQIEVLTGKSVVAVEKGAVELEDGSRRAFSALYWVTGAAPHDVLRHSGLATDERGFVWTRPTLQVEGFDDLFAAGDCATLRSHPRTAKAGVFAVRQGPFLAENLRAHLRGERLRRYRPQRDFLILLNLGDGSAIGAKWGRSFEGRWVMRWKDHIDRRFMTRFQVLAGSGELTPEFRSDGHMSGRMEMLCGGCAAKVGQSVLDRALARLEPQQPRADVVLGLEAPDDAAATITPSGDVVVSSVDQFRAFSDDLWVVGRVAAVNALSDLHATGAQPRSAMALVALPSGVGAAREEQALEQLLAGGLTALGAEGVALVGGHTTTAPELLIGFSVQGIAAGGRDQLMTLSSLQPGQSLVLTKALGTGVVLHADMKGRARGPWLESCVESMIRSNGEASRIARRFGVRAATDVTGYGLAGHLAEMTRASEVSATISLGALPILPGAAELLAQGFRSTFHGENARIRKGIRIAGRLGDDPRLELVFDPQTSGGLLLGVDAARVENLVAELRAGGDATATVVGEVRGAPPDGVRLEIAD